MPGVYAARGQLPPPIGQVVPNPATDAPMDDGLAKVPRGDTPRASPREKRLDFP